MKTSLAGQTIVVMGATGQQGGATGRHLLAERYSVRAVVRDPRSPGSQRLANIGVELVVGDMDDRESLRAAVRDAYGIFSVQPALIPPTFADNELQRGLNLADAAHEAGIAHVVYSSVAGPNRRTGIPHWEIKGQIEEHIRALGLPFTMLRPTHFMDMRPQPRAPLFPFPPSWGAAILSSFKVLAIAWADLPSTNRPKIRRTRSASAGSMATILRGCSGAAGVGSGCVA
jgi:uncharacterized protein YbjT (DUF2867 family)